MASSSITNVTATPRQIDFVTSFGRDWSQLLAIMGITRPIKKANGAVLKSKSVKVTLNEDQVEKGEQIKLSTFEIVETPYEEIEIEKYKTKVPIEDIKTYGYDVACVMTDEAFKIELDQKITGKFYTYLNKGTLKGNQKTWQRALSIAKGAVLNKFKKMKRQATEVVGFANIMDAYDYLGDAQISTQTVMGIQYVENFLGYRVLFLLSDEEIARGRVIATPKNNIVLYYVDASDPDFSKADLVYHVEGKTNLVGYAIKGDYDTASSNGYAIMGMTLFAEYLDGIAVVDVDAEKDNKDPEVTVTTPEESGTQSGE